MNGGALLLPLDAMLATPLLHCHRYDAFDARLPLRACLLYAAAR